MRHYLQNYWQQPRSGATLSRRSDNHWQKRLIPQRIRSANQTLAKLSRNDDTNQGFALPMALGMGLIMLLVGVTMILRSQDDQVTASAQKSTSQSLSIAETGVTQVQAFLNKYRGFSTKNYPWTNYLVSLMNPCGSDDVYYIAASNFNDWISVGSGTDRFKVISYTAPVNSIDDAVLVVEGQARQGSNTKSSTRLQVKIPVIPDANFVDDPPGAWAQNFGLGNNRIEGDVIDASCPPGSISSAERDQISGSLTVNPSKTMPPPLSVPPEAISLSPITTGLSLPRAGDSANGNNEYIYHVRANGSNKSIDLSGNNKLIIQPGMKVTLYLEGNIDVTGGGIKIGHNCYDTSNPPDGTPDVTTKVSGCEPTNFQIFGSQNTTSILLSGSNIIDAFIFAPNAIHSGVNGAAQIRGSVWLKEWDRANGNHTVVVQTAAWNNLPSALWPKRISPPRSWQRQEANDG